MNIIQMITMIKINRIIINLGVTVALLVNNYFFFFFNLIFIIY